MCPNYIDHAQSLDRGLASVTGTKDSAGDNTIIAAPGLHHRLVLVHYCVQNESAVATTMILKDGAVAFDRVLGNATGSGKVVAMTPGREKRLSENAALVLNLSGANACGFSVHYFLEIVR